MTTLYQLLQTILHLDSFLITFVNHYGFWAYAVLFAIVFCETGLVVIPFLPGDSLLFAAGSIAAKSQHVLNIQLLFLVLVLASTLGNKTNYLIGRTIGPRVFSAPHRWFFNKQHLAQAHQFYEKHGGKTIILARFLPIVRTFVPFVAGVSEMGIRAFSFYNIISALLWVGLLLGTGYCFGAIPIIKNNFSFVIYSIVTISLLPPVIAFIYRQCFARSKKIGSVPR